MVVASGVGAVATQWRAMEGGAAIAMIKGQGGSTQRSFLLRPLARLARLLRLGHFRRLRRLAVRRRFGAQLKGAGIEIRPRPPSISPPEWIDGPLPRPLGASRE